MKISDVKVMLVDNDPRLKAYVIITIDGCFVIRDIKIIAGEEGLFVAMPSKKTKIGKYLDIAHPINKETRDEMEEIVLSAYQTELESKPEVAE